MEEGFASRLHHATQVATYTIRAPAFTPTLTLRHRNIIKAVRKWSQRSEQTGVMSSLGRVSSTWVSMPPTISKYQ